MQQEIEAHRLAEAVPPEQLHLIVDAAHVAMRLRGGYLTQLTLVAQETGEVRDMLYCEPDLRRASLVATHAMMPVGRHAGVGGEHGHLRWMQYDLHKPGEFNDEFSQNHVIGRGGRGLPLVTRQLKLWRNRLEISNWVNAREYALDTSIGERFYWALPAGGPKDVRINDCSIDSLLRPGAAAAIARGEAQFWPGYHGPLHIAFPDREFLFEPSAAGFSGAEDQPVGGLSVAGLLMWQKPGSPSISLEATAGYRADGTNTGLHIPSNAAAVLGVGITALR